MTIWYDTPRVVTFRGKVRRTAHLMSTLTGPEATAELDAFAKSIGLRLWWRQNPGTATEHYDLFDGAIERAHDAGAVCVPPRELVAACVKPKRAAVGVP